jgi:hypothetical protein
MIRMILIAMLCLLLAGCNLEQIEQARVTAAEVHAGMAVVQAAVEQAVVQKALIDAALEEMPPGETRDKAVAVSAKLDEAITVGTMWLQKATAAVGLLHAELAGADDPLDVAEGVIKAAEPFIPAPWGKIVFGLGGLAIGLGRACWNRYLARKTIRSVNQLVARVDPAEKAEIAYNQGKLAGALVDEAQGKKFALPF